MIIIKKGDPYMMCISKRQFTSFCKRGETKRKTMKIYVKK